ncbi:MAG: universal stress protein [Acidimicrobiales bacterium]
MALVIVPPLFQDDGMTTIEARTDLEARTVVGIDGSQGSEAALRWCIAREDRLGPIQPILSWQIPWWALASGTPDVAVPIPIEDIERANEQKAAEALATVNTQKLLPVQLLRGAAGPTLVKAAEGKRLLAVGTRGHGAIADTILGSVSTYCVNHARIPVAVIPEMKDPDKPAMDIVVGVDGSANADEALAWALRIRRPGATIKVLSTWSFAPYAELGVIGPAADTLEAAATALANDSLARALALDSAADASGEDVEIDIVYGDPRSALEEASRTADLLVIGATGHRGLTRLLLGSVAAGLLHKPLCPTVVVPSAREPIAD